MLQGSKPCYHPKLGRGRQAANRGEPQLISVLLIAVLLITQPRFHACLVLHSLVVPAWGGLGQKTRVSPRKSERCAPAARGAPALSARMLQGGDSRQGDVLGDSAKRNKPRRDAGYRAGQSQQSPSGRGARAGKTRCHLCASSCSCEARLLLLLLKICKGSWPR